jgi:hypothetical protein
MLLCGMWFVPSANATDGQKSDMPAPSAHQQSAALTHAGDPLDTTHYLIGGSLFLGLGTASVAIARRRTTTG